MARPKSDDKRNAILSAATQIFAERGLAAPTSAISNLAGVAEGSLFTYFKNKDELLNELYREIKLDLESSKTIQQKPVALVTKSLWLGLMKQNLYLPERSNNRRSFRFLPDVKIITCAALARPHFPANHHPLDTEPRSTDHEAAGHLAWTSPFGARLMPRCIVHRAA